MRACLYAWVRSCMRNDWIMPSVAVRARRLVLQLSKKVVLRHGRREAHFALGADAFDLLFVEPAVGVEALPQTLSADTRHFKPHLHFALELALHLFDDQVLHLRKVRGLHALHELGFELPLHYLRDVFLAQFLAHALDRVAEPLFGLLLRIMCADKQTRWREREVVSAFLRT